MATKLLDMQEELNILAAFVDQINPNRIIASVLPAGTQDDPLAGLLKLGQPEIEGLCMGVGKSVAQELWKQMQRVRGAGEAGAGGEAGGNSKFALEDDADLPKAAFREIKDFHGGLQERLEGLPHYDLLKAIRAEHCDSEDSKDKFKNPNYGITTTPAAEFEVVTNKEKGQAFGGGERKVKHWDDLRHHPDVKEAKLMEPEVWALILHIGPMYQKYNAEMRKFPKPVLDSNKGNKNLNTITAVVSWIKKLSAIALIPSNKIVYRGHLGLKLPKKFRTPDARGVRGGCEYGLLITTTNLATALQYSRGKKLPTVFRTTVGTINISASLQFLSQYASEAEILFTLLSFVEVVGEPQVECIDGVWVEVISVAISANLLSETVEEMAARRHTMHCSNAGFLKLEVFRDLNQLAASDKLLPRLQQDGSAQYEANSNGGGMEGFKEVGAELIKQCKQDFAAVVASQKAHGDAYCNDDEQYKVVVADLLEKKRTAVSKVKLYLEDPSLFLLHVREMSLQAVREQVLGKLCRELSAAQRGGDAEVGAHEKLKAQRGAAVALCKETGRLVAHAEEQDSEGATALMRAVLTSDAASVRLLVPARSDPSREVEGQTALRVAAPVGMLSVLLHSLPPVLQWMARSRSRICLQ